MIWGTLSGMAMQGLAKDAKNASPRVRRFILIFACVLFVAWSAFIVVVAWDLWHRPPIYGQTFTRWPLW